MKKVPAGKHVLDACCGHRMFWFDKHHPNALYIDNRTVEPMRMSNRAIFSVKPDVVMDFRKMAFPDASFSLVVFDPPHVLRSGKKSFLATKYGSLDEKTWRDDLRAGFAECWRVLRPQGTLVFKWADFHVPLKEVLALAPAQPLFGNRTPRQTGTHWLVFLKLD